MVSDSTIDQFERSNPFATTLFKMENSVWILWKAHSIFSSEYHHLKWSAVFVWVLGLNMLVPTKLIVKQQWSIVYIFFWKNDRLYLKYIDLT